MADETKPSGTPPENLCCLCTMEDITLEDGNYVEYQSYPSMTWKPALYEQSVIEKLLQEQFHDYLNKVKTTDCQAELRRLLSEPPPLYLKDEHALPLAQETDTHLHQLWFASDDSYRSSKLDGAKEGDERVALWEQLKEFLVSDKARVEEEDEKDN